jgi:hypothetical protein
VFMVTGSTPEHVSLFTTSHFRSSGFSNLATVSLRVIERNVEKLVCVPTTMSPMQCTESLRYLRFESDCRQLGPILRAGNVRMLHCPPSFAFAQGAQGPVLSDFSGLQWLRLTAGGVPVPPVSAFQPVRIISLEYLALDAEDTPIAPTPHALARAFAVQLRPRVVILTSWAQLDELLSCVPCLQSREVPNPCALIEGSNLEVLDITRIPAQRISGSLFSTYVALKSKAAARFPRLREVQITEGSVQQVQVHEALSQAFEQSQRLVGGVKRVACAVKDIKPIDEVELAMMLEDGCAILSPCKTCFGSKTRSVESRTTTSASQAAPVAAAAGVEWFRESAAQEHALAMQRRELETQARAAAQQRDAEQDQIRRERAEEAERLKQQHERERVHIQAAQAEIMRIQLQAREELERAARAAHATELVRAAFLAEQQQAQEAMRKHQEEMNRERSLLEQQRAEMQAAAAEALRKASEERAEAQRAIEAARAAEAAQAAAQREADEAAARRWRAEEMQRQIAENIRRDAEEAKVRKEAKLRQEAQPRQAAEAERRRRKEEDERERHAQHSDPFQPFLPRFSRPAAHDRAAPARTAIDDFAQWYEDEFLKHPVWNQGDNAKVRSRLVKKLAVAVSFDKCGKGPLNEEAIARARAVLDELGSHNAARLSNVFDKSMHLLRRVFPNGTDASLCEEISKLSFQYVK